MNRKIIQLIVGLVVVLLAGAYLILRFSGPADYYKTPTEIKGQGDSFSDKTLRVGGRITASSIGGSEAGNFGSIKVKFKLVDEKESLPVVYEGPIPNTFKDGAEAVAEGTYTSKGIFEANRILMKCPSQYLPERAVGGLFKILGIERVLYR